ncbi:hypothetical protein GW17_00056162, partial [Ensete ventricosum]
GSVALCLRLILGSARDNLGTQASITLHLGPILDSVLRVPQAFARSLLSIDEPTPAPRVAQWPKPLWLYASDLFSIVPGTQALTILHLHLILDSARDSPGA